MDRMLEVSEGTWRANETLEPFKNGAVAAVAAVLGFLDNPRESSPRGGRVVPTNQTGTNRALSDQWASPQPAEGVQIDQRPSKRYVTSISLKDAHATGYAVSTRKDRLRCEGET